MKQVEKNKISIVVPVYNGEKYLGQTLDAILASTYTNIEVVIVDDGSKDKSKEIYDHYMRKDKRIKVFPKHNAGIAEARNWGITKATGEYVCFCDQDDIVNKNMYSFMMERITRDKTQVCVCSTARLLGEKILPYEKLEDGVYQDEGVLKNLLFPILFNGININCKNKNVKIYGTIWKFMIERSLLIENNLSFKKFIDFEDDFIMAIDILASVKRVSSISQMLYYWRINNQSESSCSKYIECLDKKILKLDFYILECLKKRGISNTIINKFREVRQLNNCIMIIENENNTSKKMTLKKHQLARYMDEVKGFVTFGNVKIISKGHIRMKLISWLLSKELLSCTFIADYAVSAMVDIIKRSKVLSRFERRIKGI